MKVIATSLQMFCFYINLFQSLKWLIFSFDIEHDFHSMGTLFKHYIQTEAG